MKWLSNLFYINFNTSPYVTIISPFLNTKVNKTLDIALCYSALRKSI